MIVRSKDQLNCTNFIENITQVGAEKDSDQFYWYGHLLINYRISDYNETN